MMMSALLAGGMPLLIDDKREPDASNPKGYYEFEPVKRLASGDTDWVRQASGMAVKVISSLLKSLPAKQKYRVIFMEREISEILASQRRMLSRAGKDLSQDDETERLLEQSYISHLEDIRLWLKGQDNFDVLFVSYNDVLMHPMDAFSKIIAFLDRPLTINAMLSVIDPNLYREKSNLSVD